MIHKSSQTCRRRDPVTVTQYFSDTSCGARFRRAALALCGGMALAIALRAPGADAPAGIDWSAARLVRVELVDESFVPDKLTFRAGVAYHLRLENTGTEMHEFTAPEFFRTVTLMNPEALDVPLKEVTLQPKKSRDVFFVPQKPGRYQLTCADHDWAGMVGEITVE